MRSSRSLLITWSIGGHNDGEFSEPAYLTNYLLRPEICSNLWRLLPSGCSTYLKYALRAPQVANTTSRNSFPASRRELVRYAG
jgi:hypothetical protein